MQNLFKIHILFNYKNKSPFSLENGSDWTIVTTKFNFPNNTHTSSLPFLATISQFYLNFMQNLETSWLTHFIFTLHPRPLPNLATTDWTSHPSSLVQSNCYLTLIIRNCNSEFNSVMAHLQFVPNKISSKIWRYIQTNI